MKTQNLIIHETKQNIINVLNQSGLPVSVCSMILHETSSSVDIQLNQVLQQEMLMEKQASEETEGKEENS